MKLFQVMASNKKGGAERFFCHLARSLTEQSIDQSLLVRHNSPYIQELQASTTCYPLPFGGTLDFTSRYQIKRLIQTQAPDIILTWMTRASELVGKLHKNKKYQHVARLGGYYDLNKYKHCDHFVVNTKDLADYLLKSNIDTKRVHYISNFTDEHPGTPMQKPDRPLVVSLGRLHENKAFDTLIKAAALVPDIELWIGGQGPLHTDLTDLIKTLNLTDRVKLIGWLDQPEDLIATADLFVCPSRHEPLGNVILEGWQQQKPVLSTRSQGGSELITHEQNGYLVPIDDPKAMAAGIKDLLQSPSDMQSLAMQGYQSYQSHFSKEIITRQYIDFFNQLI